MTSGRLLSLPTPCEILTVIASCSLERTGTIKRSGGNSASQKVFQILKEVWQVLWHVSALLPFEMTNQHKQWRERVFLSPASSPVNAHERDFASMHTLLWAEGASLTRSRLLEMPNVEYLSPQWLILLSQYSETLFFKSYPRKALV